MYITYITIFIFSLITSYWLRKYIRGNIYHRIVRVISINLPYLLIFLFVPFPRVDFELDIRLVLLTFILATMFILLNVKNLIYSNKRAFLLFTPKVKGEQLISRFSEISLIPVIEEFFYRGIIPLNGDVIEVVLAILLSTLLFSVAHYIGNDKSWMYHIKLIFFSLTSSSIYLMSENLVYSIIFHVIFNLPWFVTNCRVYLFHKNREDQNIAI